MLMLKGIGAVIILAVSTAFGIRASGKLRHRYKKLLAFYIFIGELADRMRSGRELSEIYGETAQGLLEYCNFEVKILQEGLNKEDISLLSDFFKGLGMSELSAAEERCRTYRELILKRMSAAEKEMNEKSRLYGVLGASAGAFLVILIV